jgi:hypothetical protein
MGEIVPLWESHTSTALASVLSVTECELARFPGSRLRNGRLDDQGKCTRN